MKGNNLDELFISGQENKLSMPDSKELENKTGITLKHLRKIRNNPTLMKAFKILLLTVGLFLGIVEGATQQTENGAEQIGGQEQVDNNFEKK